MKILNFNNQQFQAEKIIKTEKDIIGEDLNGNEVFTFRGVTDFSLFTLEQGQEFDINDSEIQAKALAQLTMENADLKQQLQTLASTVVQCN